MRTRFAPRHSSLFQARRAVAVVAAVAAGLLLSACGSDSVSTARTAASTSTEQPIRAVDEAAGEQAAPVNVSVDGGKAGVGVTFRKITIVPGASTGEHCHYGQLIAVVAAGELTHHAAIYPGGVHVYKKGDSIIEGKGYRHEGRNEGKVDTVLWVTYIIPEGKPLAETDLKKCDA